MHLNQVPSSPVTFCVTHTQLLGAVVGIPVWSRVWAQHGKSIPNKASLSSNQLQNKNSYQDRKCLSPRTFPIATSTWAVLSVSMELHSSFLQNISSVWGSSIALMWEALTSTTKSPDTEITTNWICPSPTWNYWINKSVTDVTAAATAQLARIYLN